MKAFLDSIDDLIMVIDKDYQVIDVNASFLKRLKCKRDQVIGKPCFEVTKFFGEPCFSGAGTCPIEATFKTGEVSRITHTYLLGNKKHHFEVRASPVKDKTGAVTEVVEVMRDITDRVNAARALKKSEKLYRNLVESMNEGFWIIDRDFKTVFWNKKLGQILGHDPKEVVGRPASSFFEGENKERLINELEKRKAGESSKYEITVTAKSGEPVPVIMSGSPLFDEHGNPDGAFAVVTDISGIKKVEHDLIRSHRELLDAYRSLKELEKMKHEFVSNVSHELKTPLTVILGYIELILSEDMGEITNEQKKSLEISRKSVEKLNNLIDNLIELKSIRSLMSIKRELIFIDELTKEVVDEFLNSTRVKGIEIKSNVEKDLPLIRGNKNKIRQVLLNLIDNAIKFTPSGRGRIEIEVKEEGNSILVAVKDNGIGIESEETSKIFNRFYQVDASSTRKYSGTGIGLAISKEIIEAHDGKIWAESEQGKGSTIYFTIPEYI